MNYTLFISDLHLQESDPAKLDLFCNFLANEATKADALYILGDLFEIWVGDDHCSPLNNKTQQAMKNLGKANVPLYLVPGNHDFLLGREFALKAGCKILKDPTKIYLYDKPTLLAHGDMFCTNKFAYMWLRKIFHYKLGQSCFLQLPISTRISIANQVNRKSSKKIMNKHFERPDVVLDSMVEVMKNYFVTQTIHGHTHKFMINDVATDGTPCRRISIASWDEKPMAVQYFKDHSAQLLKL